MRTLKELFTAADLERLPRTRTAIVHLSLDDISTLTEGDFLEGEEVVPGISCRVGKLFD